MVLVATTASDHAAAKSGDEKISSALLWQCSLMFEKSGVAATNDF
jgi:hypothetical protein